MTSWPLSQLWEIPWGGSLPIHDDEMLTGQSCPGLMQITTAAGSPWGQWLCPVHQTSFCFISPGSILSPLCDVPWALAGVPQLSYLGPRTLLLFIFGSLATLWASALTSIGAIFSFLPLPSPLSPSSSSISPPPFSPYMWRPEADVCVFLCICQPYYLIFNIIYYCVRGWQVSERSGIPRPHWPFCS